MVALLGIGLVMPRSVDSTQRRALVQAIARFRAAQVATSNEEAPILPLHLGAAGVLQLQACRLGRTQEFQSAARTWSRPARQWATATPVALDRNPGDLHDADSGKRLAAFDAATAEVVEAVRRVGLPKPAEIHVVRSCVLPGSTKPRSFPRFPSDTSRAQRVLVHVRLVFAAPVRGPILVGAVDTTVWGFFVQSMFDREVIS